MSIDKELREFTNNYIKEQNKHFNQQPMINIQKVKVEKLQQQVKEIIKGVK